MIYLAVLTKFYPYSTSISPLHLIASLELECLGKKGGLGANIPSFPRLPMLLSGWEEKRDSNTWRRERLTIPVFWPGDPDAGKD